jgi:hypothetical protein
LNTDFGSKNERQDCEIGMGEVLMGRRRVNGGTMVGGLSTYI